MQLILKLSATVAIILFCTHIGRRWPTLGGLIATMPLTGLIVLIWLYSENPGNYELMAQYTAGAFWGIFPTILFFLVAFLCFNRQIPLPLTLAAGFGIWLIGAFLHQWFLR